VSIAGDCEDAVASAFPGAVEVCTDETDKNCDGVVSFDDPDYDGACGAADPCPSTYGFECDTAADTAADTGVDTGTDTQEDTGSEPEECDTATTVVTVFQDEEDPELYEGGWRCGVTGEPRGLLVLLGALIPLVRKRRARAR